MNIKHFFDATTATFSYVVHDLETHDAIIIDPVLDFDLFSASISHASAGIIKKYVEEHELVVRLVLDTHVHADHMTASHYMRKIFNVKSAIGAGFKTSQNYFSNFYGLTIDDYEPAYDMLLEHGQTFTAGSIEIKVLAVPGHTPSCTAYVIDTHVFSGDTLFQPTLGCGRADFPGGSARDLFHSIKTHLYSLPDSYTLWVGHDYPEGGNAPQPSTTIGVSKITNRLIKNSTSFEQFVEQREKKDRTLGTPRLLLSSLQINIVGGQLPHKDIFGRQFLRIPLKQSDNDK